jgi:hypothetical protein
MIKFLIVSSVEAHAVSSRLHLVYYIGILTLKESERPPFFSRDITIESLSVFPYAMTELKGALLCRAPWQYLKPKESSSLVKRFGKLYVQQFRRKHWGLLLPKQRKTHFRCGNILPS